MTELQQVLVTALADAYAVRLPIRSTEPTLRQNRYAELEQLETLGMAFRVGGDDVSRKSGERLLAGIPEGLAIITRSPGDKYARIRLTLPGELSTRSLCGLDNCQAARLLLAYVAERTDREPKTLDRLWMPETAMVKGNPNTQRNRQYLAAVEQDFCLAHRLGWLDTNSSCVGHVRYRVSAAGWAELDSPTATPSFELHERDESAVKLYRLRQDATLNRLANAEPDWAREIGQCPLPVADVGVPVI